MAQTLEVVYGIVSITLAIVDRLLVIVDILKKREDLEDRRRTRQEKRDAWAARFITVAQAPPKPTPKEGDE